MASSAPGKGDGNHGSISYHVLHFILRMTYTCYTAHTFHITYDVYLEKVMGIMAMLLPLPEILQCQRDCSVLS